MLPVILTLGLLSAQVEGASGPSPLSFEDALKLAEQAPMVVGARRAVVAKRGMDDRISLLTANPQLSIQAGYRALSPPERGFEGQAALYQALNLSGYGGARRTAAREEERLLAAEARLLGLGQRLEAVRAWLMLWGAQEALREARADVALATEFTQRVERAAKSALLTAVDTAEARAYLAEAELQALSLEGEIAGLTIAMTQAVGWPADRAFRLAGPPPDPPLPDEAALRRAFDGAGGLPQPLAARLAVTTERAREAEAHAARGVQLQLGVVATREAPSALAVVGAAQLTMPLFDRGERERAVLLASRARLEGQEAAGALAARAALIQVAHEVEHSGAVLRQLQHVLVPATAETVRLREAASRAGQGTVLELLLARRAAATARGRSARALAEHTAARTCLRLLLGEITQARSGQ